MTWATSEGGRVGSPGTVVPRVVDTRSVVVAQVVPLVFPVEVVVHLDEEGNTDNAEQLEEGQDGHRHEEVVGQVADHDAGGESNQGLMDYPPAGLLGRRVRSLIFSPSCNREINTS